MIGTEPSRDRIRALTYSLVLPVLSGLMMAAAFPPLEWAWCAWIALAPLIISTARLSGRGALLAGLTTGAVFRILNLAWLRTVTISGWLALAAYCALYVVPFAGFAYWWVNAKKARRPGYNILFMATCVPVWVFLESALSRLADGFPWNLLAVSQHAALPLIQNAAWGGAAAISGLIVFINAAVSVTVLRYMHDRPRKYRAHLELMVALLAVALFWTGGMRMLLRETPETVATVRLALIQPNIAQNVKWSPDYMDHIRSTLRRLTTAAIQTSPDMVIWPETALPDFMRDSPVSRRLVEELARDGAPLLVGTMDYDRDDRGERVFFNSAILFDRRGRRKETYHKQHLVLFGEYVPFEEYLPFLQSIGPLARSFTGGEESVVFRLENYPQAPFSVLICFEDAFAPLARAAVRSGARWLVNITNDAWFDGTSGARQHLRQAVLRSVENRVPMVRVANSGITCVIDPFGRVHDELTDPSGRHEFAGFRLTDVPLPASKEPAPLLLRRGPVFEAAAATAGALLLLLAAADVYRRRNHVKGDR